jgi:hypothetical protein
MTECFKKHPCDKLALHTNTQPLASCKTYMTDSYGEHKTIVDVPVLTCGCLWRTYQKEAEDIVAPDGVLIADPRERNKRINAAYAKLWLSDHRFQWAGLAAFASKQVGCGMLQAVKAQHNSMELPWVVGPLPYAASEGAEKAKNESSKYMLEMLALGNTTLFLDIYPLHEFYKKRGLKELKQCLKLRQDIYGHPKFPVLWPVGQKALQFGRLFPEILEGFAAIDAGNISESVAWLARHEQINILQPIMYNNPIMRGLLQANQAMFVTNLFPSYTQPVELTLASQCKKVDDGRTIGFSDSVKADLADPNQRMEFVLRAANQFNCLLNDERYASLIEQSIQNIAAGGGVQ